MSLTNFKERGARRYGRLAGCFGRPSRARDKSGKYVALLALLALLAPGWLTETPDGWQDGGFSGNTSCFAENAGRFFSREGRIFFIRGPHFFVPGPGIFTSGPHFFVPGPGIFMRGPHFQNSVGAAAVQVVQLFFLYARGTVADATGTAVVQVVQHKTVNRNGC